LAISLGTQHSVLSTQSSALSPQHWTLTSTYLARKEAEYDALKAEIADLKGKMNGVRAGGKAG